MFKLNLSRAAGRGSDLAATDQIAGQQGALFRLSRHPGGVVEGHPGVLGTGREQGGGERGLQGCGVLRHAEMARRRLQVLAWPNRPIRSAGLTVGQR